MRTGWTTPIQTGLKHSRVRLSTDAPCAHTQVLYLAWFSEDWQIHKYVFNGTRRRCCLIHLPKNPKYLIYLRGAWGEYHIKKLQTNKTPFPGHVYNKKNPVWHMLWWNKTTLLSACRLQRWPHCWFWSSLAILGKELWEISFKQTANRRRGLNQQKTKLSISTWYSGSGFLGWGWNKPSSSSHINLLF